MWQPWCLASCADLPDKSHTSCSRSSPRSRERSSGNTLINSWNPSNYVELVTHNSISHLNVGIRDPLDMSVPDLLVPYLQRLAPYAIQDGEEAGLERVLEHIGSRRQNSCLALITFVLRNLWDSDWPNWGKPKGRYLNVSCSRGLSPLYLLSALLTHHRAPYLSASLFIRESRLYFQISHSCSVALLMFTCYGMPAHKRGRQIQILIRFCTSKRLAIRITHFGV